MDAPAGPEARLGALPRMCLSLGVLAGLVLAYVAGAAISRILHNCGGEAGAGWTGWMWLFGLALLNTFLAVMAWAWAANRPKDWGNALFVAGFVMVAVAALAVVHAMGSGADYAASLAGDDTVASSCPG